MPSVCFVSSLFVALQLFGVLGAAPRVAADAASLFDRGVTWERFFNSVRRQKDVWQRNAATAEVPADLAARLSRVRAGLRMLVVTEDWCSDSVNTVPYIAKLSERVGIELRIVDRVVGAPLLNQYRTLDQRIATPLVVWIRDGHDAGAWVERPTALQKLFVAMRNAHDNERLVRKEEWYRQDRGQSTLTEIVALLERAPTGVAVSK
jgi:hypothetical protein